MFTGIIEGMAVVEQLEKKGNNLAISLSSPFTNELNVDQSVSHNGVCLTVTDIRDNFYSVTAIDETLKKTNLRLLKVGDVVNLERSMKMNSRIDGHLVQGHVDGTAICTEMKEQNGSWLFYFENDGAIKNLTVSKGSVCVNGVSLTVVESEPIRFSVAIIPYTFEHTNFRFLRIGSMVNVEYDILGKYVMNYLSQMKIQTLSS